MTDQLSLLEPGSYDSAASRIAADALFASGSFTTNLWWALERLSRGPTTAWDWWQEEKRLTGKDLELGTFAPRLTNLAEIACAAITEQLFPIRGGKSKAHRYFITDLGRAMLRNRAAIRATNPEQEKTHGRR